MATLISRSNGNFTDAATWAVAGLVSLLDSQVGTTASTTSYQNSSTFIPLASTVDAILLKVSSKSGIIGTLDVSFYNNTTASESGLVTVNIGDIPLNGWAAFKLPTPVVMNGIDSYLIRVRHSSGASTVTLFRDATVANWSRLLQTTTTAAPTAADRLVIVGELTGAGTGTDFTVTMNNTATTIFGDNSTTVPSVTVNKRGILQLATAAATNYYLKLNSSLVVYDGGTFNLGTSGTPLPVSSTAVLEFNSTVAGDFGLEVYGTMNIWGATKLSWCLLTANVAAAGTILTVQDTTGWQVGDEVCIGSTSRTATECEKGTILTVDSATQITLTAGVTYAHSGTAPTQGEVGNLTRNVKIRGISLSLTGYIVCRAAGLMMARYVETTGLGINAGSKGGLTVETTTGSIDWRYGSLHEPVTGAGYGFLVTSASGSSITLSNNTLYNTRNECINTAATTGVQVIQNNLCMRNVTGSLVQLGDVGGVFTGNYIVGSIASGLTIIEAAPIGTMTGNVIHSCVTNGFTFSTAGSFGNTSLSCTIWRCLSAGIGLTVALVDITFTGCTLFGNGLNILPPSTNGTAGRPTFVSCSFSGDTSFTSTHGITGGSTGAIRAAFVDCTFGVVSGIRTAHTVGDIGGAQHYQLTLWNTILASATEVITPASMLGETSYIKSSNHDQVPGQLRNWYKYGRIESDIVLFSTVAPSLRFIPTDASNKLSYVVAIGAISTGSSVTISAKIRQSVLGDSAAYNGTAPRLIIRRNDQLGVTSDTVIATATAASMGNWETVTGTIPTPVNNGVYEILVDVNGTTGWVNVDEIVVPNSPDTTGLLYGFDGEYHAVAGASGSVGGSNANLFNYLGRYAPFVIK